MNEYFYFKGNRTYLQAATLMDYIIRHHIAPDDELKDIDFSMSRFTDRICDVIADGNKVQPDTRSVVGQFYYGEQKILAFETPDKITRRVEYDEDMILNQCELVDKDNRIIIPANTDQFSFMEKAIAAYKALLNKLFGKSYKSFFFIRITLDTIPEGQVEITYNRIISKKYFQGTITQHGQKIGALFYGARQL